MNFNEDIRWKQRLENFKKAFFQLEKGVKKYKETSLNELEKQGLIQSFEYNYELAWNLLRDYFVYQGVVDIKGSRDAIRLGFQYGIIENGEIWIEMIGARNQTSHTYNEKLVEEIIKKIIEEYYIEFQKLIQKFESLKDQ